MFACFALCDFLVVIIGAPHLSATFPSSQLLLFLFSLACILSIIKFVTLRRNATLLVGKTSRCHTPIRCTYHLSQLQASPHSNGPAFVFTCHTLRFCTMSSVTLYSFMSSVMLSCHLFLGLSFFAFLHLPSS